MQKVTSECTWTADAKLRRLATMMYIVMSPTIDLPNEKESYASMQDRSSDSVFSL